MCCSATCRSRARSCPPPRSTTTSRCCWSTTPTTGSPRCSRCRPRRPCSRRPRRLADYVVLDTPPLTQVIDAMPLARQVDDVVLVVRLGSSNLAQLARLGDLLDQNAIRPAGFVVVGGTSPEEQGDYRIGAAPADARGRVADAPRSPRRRSRSSPPSAEPAVVTARAELPTKLLAAGLAASVLSMGILAGVDPALAIGLTLGLVLLIIAMANLTAGICLLAFLTFLETVLPAGSAVDLQGGGPGAGAVLVRAHHRGGARSARADLQSCGLSVRPDLLRGLGRRERRLGGGLGRGDRLGHPLPAERDAVPDRLRGGPYPRAVPLGPGQPRRWAPLSPPSTGSWPARRRTTRSGWESATRTRPRPPSSPAAPLPRRSPSR